MESCNQLINCNALKITLYQLRLTVLTVQQRPALIQPFVSEVTTILTATVELMSFMQVMCYGRLTQIVY